MPLAELLAIDDWPLRQAVVGAPTGLSDLDLVTGGLVPGRVWVVTGRAGVGLTVFAGGLAAGAAFKGKRRTVLVCGRHPASHVVGDLVSAQALVPALKLSRGQVDSNDEERLARVISDLRSAELNFIEAARELHFGAGPAETWAWLAGLMEARPFRPEVVVVDDLQEIEAGPPVEALMKLGAVARRANVALVATVARESVIDDEGRPIAQAVRAADVFVELVRDEQDNSASPYAGEIEIRVRRNRYGPTPDITAAFQGHYRRIVEMSRPV